GGPHDTIPHQRCSPAPAARRPARRGADRRAKVPTRSRGHDHGLPRGAGQHGGRDADARRGGGYPVRLRQAPRDGPPARVRRRLGASERALPGATRLPADHRARVPVGVLREPAGEGTAPASATSTTAPPADSLTVDVLRTLARKVSNWGRWGPDDEVGTVNFITPEVVRRAAACVKRGDVFSLGLPLGADGPQLGTHGRMNPIHLMSALEGRVSAEGDFRYSDDLIVMPL